MRLPTLCCLILSGCSSGPASDSQPSSSGEVGAPSSGAESTTGSAPQPSGGETAETAATQGPAGTTAEPPGPGTLPIPETSSTTGIDPAPAIIDYEFCELEAQANAEVVGTTPDGEFNGRYAWFGWLTCNAEGLSPTLVVVEDPADLAAAVMVSPSGDAVPTPSIEWYLFGACDPSGGWVGEGNVTVFLRANGPWHQTGGQIEILDTYRIFDEVDHADPPRMHGVITMNEGEFELTGEFTASYCGPLSYEIGCDE